MQERKNENIWIAKSHKYVAFVACIFIVFAIVLFIRHMIGIEKDEFIKPWFLEINTGWQQVLDDGSKIDVEYPISVECEVGESKNFVNAIPENISYDAILTIITGQCTEIYIGDELRYQYDTKDNPLRGDVVKGIVHQINILPEDQGKELLIIKNDKNERNGKVTFVSVGDSYGTYQHFFSEYGLKMIAALLLIFLAVFIILMNIGLNRKYHNSIDAYILGLGVIAVGIWAVCDNMLFQYFFKTAYIDGVMSFLVTFLLPFPFIFYLNRIQDYRYNKLYLAFEIILIVNTFVFCVLHEIGTYSFLDSLLIVNAAEGVVVLGTIYTVIRDFVKKYDEKYHDLAVGFIGLCVFGFIEIIHLNFLHKESSAWDGVFLLLGMYFLLYKTSVMVLNRMGIAQVEAAKAIKASEMKTNFLANMSHEIRTPIHAVIGLDEMILRESKDEQILEYAKDIKQSANMLLNLVNDILDVSKIESGKMEIVKSDYEVKRLIRNSYQVIKLRAEEKSLSVNVEIDETLPTKLNGDEVRIRQMMVNLLTNAVKYTKRGSITLRVFGETIEDKFYLKVAVKDTGIGIKKEDLEQLAQKFHRIEESENREIEGSGLGLNITSQFLAMMGSKLKVDSIYGVGSIFSFDLEQEIVDETPIGAIDLEENEEHSSESDLSQDNWIAPSAKILVVDDNKVNLTVFTHLLKRRNMQISQAESGPEMLGMAEKEKYDIIFLDHMMPDMDGIETLHRMQKMDACPNETTPVIALTANAVVGAKERYLREGFFDYLSKPIEPGYLDHIILGILLPEQIEYDV